MHVLVAARNAFMVCQRITWLFLPPSVLRLNGAFRILRVVMNFDLHLSLIRLAKLLIIALHYGASPVKDVIVPFTHLIETCGVTLEERSTFTDNAWIRSHASKCL